MLGKNGWPKVWPLSPVTKHRQPMAELSDDELLAELGVSIQPILAVGRTPREEHVIAGFEDIVKFYEEYGRVPQHGEEREIFERVYAVRLDRLRSLVECRELLAAYDRYGLLRRPATTAEAAPEELDDEALLAELGVTAPENADISVLKHVASREAKRAAEKKTKRTPSEENALFKPLFDQIRHELDT